MQRSPASLASDFAGKKSRGTQSSRRPCGMVLQNASHNEHTMLSSFYREWVPIFSRNTASVLMNRPLSPPCAGRSWERHHSTLMMPMVSDIHSTYSPTALSYGLDMESPITVVRSVNQRLRCRDMPGRKPPSPSLSCIAHQLLQLRLARSGTMGETT